MLLLCRGEEHPEVDREMPCKKQKYHSHQSLGSQQIFRAD